jgi:ABC-type nitrate/sulfonate/bicarbonate transport system ATPase subunit
LAYFLNFFNFFNLVIVIVQLFVLLKPRHDLFDAYSRDAITRRKMHKWLIEIRRRWLSSILFVTHDIEEALLLADRIYVFSSRPARVKAEYNLLDINNEQREGIKQEIISILEEEAID